MTAINIMLADMTAEELRTFARALLEQMNDTQIKRLSVELMKKEVQTLTAAERAQLLNELHEIKKRSASHE